MPRKWLLGACLSALIAVAVIAGVASATGSDNRASGRVTLEFLITEPAFTEVDLTGEGETAGDLLVVDSPLYNRNRTRQVGHTPLSCVVVRVGSNPRCNGELVLEGFGQITLQGVFGEDEDRMAITGGTGVFAEANGQTQAVFDPAAGALRLTVHLRGVRRHDVRRLLG
jgi:allene oxide cyclase